MVNFILFYVFFCHNNKNKLPILFFPFLIYLFILETERLLGGGGAEGENLRCPVERRVGALSVLSHNQWDHDVS